MPVCPQCHTQNPEGSRLCTGCHTLLTPSAPSPPDAGPISAPLPPPVLGQQPWQVNGNTPPPPQYAADPVSGLIPYRNGPALTSYYLGLFSGFPVLGLFMAGAALVLGIKGLRQVRENPAIHGKKHAIVGIVTGIIGGLFNLLIVIGIVMALLFPPHPQ